MWELIVFENGNEIYRDTFAQWRIAHGFARRLYGFNKWTEEGALTNKHSPEKEGWIRRIRPYKDKLQ